MKRFWEKHQSRIIPILVIAGIILLIWGIMKIIKLIKLPPDTKLKPSITDGDMLDKEEWDYTGLLAQVSTEVNDWCFDCSARCKVYEQLVKLEDNQLITIANAYKKKHKKTLREAMDDTYVNGCSTFYTQWDEHLLDRMTTLGIP
ncbi:MAG: hypothetical protein MK212_11900 [Saprospiraceae bacterium]|nr:hypothetical protein [Saprospiraceae bacterium]